MSSKSKPSIKLNKKEAQAISKFLANQWLNRDIEGLQEVVDKISRFAKENE